jgi:uncharacterized protein
MQDKTKWLEIAAVVLTGIGKIIFMDLLAMRLPFIIVAILGWSFYIVYRSRKNRSILLTWGFRMDTFVKTMRLLLPFACIAIVLSLGIGYMQDSLNLTWHIFPILILYPLWGIVQQFLVIGLVAGNLQDMERKRLGSGAIISVTAVLFGLVHYPSYWLIAGTFILALLYGWVFLKVRNIYVLGIFHGWLGALFFYTVVGRDPFLEVFGKFLN